MCQVESRYIGSRTRGCESRWGRNGVVKQDRYDLSGEGIKVGWRSSRNVALGGS